MTFVPLDAPEPPASLKSAATIALSRPLRMQPRVRLLLRPHLIPHAPAWLTLGRDVNVSIDRERRLLLIEPDGPIKILQPQGGRKGSESALLIVLPPFDLMLPLVPQRVTCRADSEKILISLPEPVTGGTSSMARWRAYPSSDTNGPASCSPASALRSPV